MQPHLARALEQSAAEYGIEFTSSQKLIELEPGESAFLSLKHALTQENVQVLYAPQLTATAIHSLTQHLGNQTMVLIVGERVTERSAEILRAGRINYLDGSGNAFISFGGVHIDARGRRGPYFRNVRAATRTRGGTNLMSPKRAQVIFALLSWEDLLKEPLRHFARVAGVSLGLLQETLELLTELGFIDRKKTLNPFRREQLLEQWVQVYPSGLGTTSMEAFLSGDIALPQHSDVPIFLSGESAVPSLKRPETLTLYCREQPRRLIRERRWKREDDRPTIFLKEQFWQDPSHSDGDPTIQLAPPLLIYADLLASYDSRQREIAIQFREQHDQLRAG